MKSTKETTMIEKDEYLITKSWNEIDNSVIENVCKILDKYNYDLLNNLIQYVAALCNLDPVDMLSISDKIYVSQSRWLLWYAYRYMTHESYEKIAERTCMEGHVFNTRSVAAGIEKMAHIIETEEIWQKRWAIIKKIIKLWRNAKVEEENEITVTVPKDWKVKVKTK